MAEPSMPAIGEAPVNPYNLLEAVNRASAVTRASWLIALTLLALVTVPMIGTTHRDLLLGAPVTLPFVAVKVPLVTYFALAPLAIIALHAALLAGHVVLANKVHAFDTAIRLLETNDRRSHPLRLEIYPYCLTEVLAGPRLGFLVRASLKASVLLGVLVLPALVLLAAEIMLVPYHSVALTTWHRGLVVADLALAGAFCALIAAPGPSWRRALARTIAVYPFSSFAGIVALVVLAFVSIAVVTIPGEPLDRLLHTAIGGDASLPGRVLTHLDRWVPRTLHPARIAAPADPAAAPPIDLAGRDLAGADLDGQRLSGADLGGANLKGARLTGADLGGARLSDANLAYAVLDRAWLAAADLTRARLVAASLKDADLEAATLTGVAAAGASFNRAGLVGADLGNASLLGADLMSATLTGANLAGARLDGARMKGADLEAAVLTRASLLGADLTDARIAAVDFRRARIWQTPPPDSDPGGLADFADADLGEPDAKAIAALEAGIAAVALPEGIAVLRETLRGVLDPAERGRWASSPERQRWQGIVSGGALSGEAYRSRLTDALARLMCRARGSAGGLAAGIVKRGAARDFRGDPAALADRLKAEDCAAARNLPQLLIQDLVLAADRSRLDAPKSGSP